METLQANSDEMKEEEELASTSTKRESCLLSSAISMDSKGVAEELSDRFRLRCSKVLSFSSTSSTALTDGAKEREEEEIRGGELRSPSPSCSLNILFHLTSCACPFVLTVLERWLDLRKEERQQRGEKRVTKEGLNGAREVEGKSNPCNVTVSAWTAFNIVRCLDSTVLTSLTTGWLTGQQRQAQQLGTLAQRSRHA
jgi:hypothetical protein